jgi:WD40 repeat protein
VAALAFSPDGALVATGDETGTLRVSDAATGAERFARPGVTGLMARAVAFSADGKWVAVGEGQPPFYGRRDKPVAHAVRVYDAATGAAGVGLQIPPSPQGCGGLAFDPRGGRLAVATYAPTVDLYDLTGGAPVRSFALPKEPDDNSPAEAWGVAFSGDGKRIAAPNYWRATATVWDADSGRVAGRIDVRGNWGGSTGMADKIALTPDGRALALTVGSDVGVWEVGSGSLVARLPSAGGRTLAFHPGGGRLFAGGQRSDLWDVAAGQQVLRFPEPFCGAAAFSPDGHRLAVADGPVVRVYDAEPRAGFPETAPPRRTGPISAVVVAAGAAFLAGWAAILLAARWALIRLLPRLGRAAGRAARRVSGAP